MAQKQTPLSFHISNAQHRKLTEVAGNAHGRKSEIVRMAISQYGKPTAEEYLNNAPSGPYVNKVNVARGGWYKLHQIRAEDLGVSVAALARYALWRMLCATTGQE